LHRLNLSFDGSKDTTSSYFGNPYRVGIEARDNAEAVAFFSAGHQRVLGAVREIPAVWDEAGAGGTAAQSDGGEY